MSNQNEAEKLTEDDIEKLADEYLKTYCALSNNREMMYAKCDFTNGYNKAIATKQSRIEELEREVEQLKAWNDSANERTEFWQNECDIAVKAAMKSQDEVERLKQSVEYWKNENSKTGNSYLKLLGEHNDLKSELKRIKTKNK